MALFSKKKEGGFEVVNEGSERVLRIDYLKKSILPSIEDSGECMLDVVSKLVETPGIGRIVLVQQRNYNYNSNQTVLLNEVARIYNHLTKQKKFIALPAEEEHKYLASKIGIVRGLIRNWIRDPIGTYVELKRFLREEKIMLGKLVDEPDINSCQILIEILKEFFELVESTKLISLVKKRLEGHRIGTREIYRQIFRAEITPNFVFTRLVSRVPTDGDEVDSYKVENADVTIFSVPEDIKKFYHINPVEFKLSEDKQELLEMARNVLIEHKPKAEEFLEPERMRATFFNIGRDLLQELAERQGVEMKVEELEELTNVLVRYTVGFGLLEVLLRDEKIQDITINGPIGTTPVFLVHQDYDECFTNIIPSAEDAENWATKFRILSGRPLDEANPILDTELTVPGARARVAIVGRPLNPKGLAYALRRHRDKPWTLPLFMENRMISPLGAGLMGFFIDGARTLLVAGTRSSGKTSFLGSLLVEVMRRFRIITTEDSVTGDCEILIRRGKKIERTKIGKLIDEQIRRHGKWYLLSGNEISGNNENIEVLAMDKKGKVIWTRASKLIRHKVQKPIYEVTTRTGRKVKVTGDHSLFGLRKGAMISEAKVNELEEGDYIAVPRKLPGNFNSMFHINLLDYIEEFDKGYLHGGSIGILFKKYKSEIIHIGKEHGHTTSLIYGWFRKEILPLKVLKDLRCFGYSLEDLNDTQFKYSHNSGSFPVVIALDKDLLTFLGLWLADGGYDKSSVLLSAVEEENREILRNLAHKYHFNITLHSDTFSLIAESETFKEILRIVFKLRGNSYTKRVPDLIFNLSQEQIAYFLRGLFSCEGCVSDKEVVLSLCSRGLLEDVQSLLLMFGINLWIGSYKDKTYRSSISSLKFLKIFQEEIGLLPFSKIEKLNLLCSKVSTHDSTDVIPLMLSDKRELVKVFSLNSNDYIKRENNLGREKIGSLFEQPSKDCQLIENLKLLQQSDIFWDQIKSITLVPNFNDYVYDFSVPECESFVVGGIVAHNTLELPIDALRELGYNIQPFKVRSALAGGATEVSAEEGIRTALRMGDSALILGEIRSQEAKALYEAMRVGALANVVAGTIHGDSPYGVYDRVVNDLNVPKTSFKATDIIVITNPVRSADGLQRWRRVMQITEVRKKWEDDPLRENGFVDLMKYDSKTDSLQPTDDLINGNSDVIKSIASNIPEWAGHWDAVWDNIILRAKMKEALVNYSLKTKKKDVLEARFVIAANDHYHRVAEGVRAEIGNLDSKRIYFEWEEWLKKAVAKV